MELSKQAGAGPERAHFSRAGLGSSGCFKVWWSEAEMPMEPAGDKEQSSGTNNSDTGAQNWRANTWEK